jgi:hypothetical protein
MMMKIDTHNGWFKGLGDVVCFAWIGATLRSRGEDVEFYAHGWRAEVLRFFQQRVTTDSDRAMAPEIGYETAMRESSKLNYLEWMAQQCGVATAVGRGAATERRGYIRPGLDLPPMEREMGRKASTRVLIFPDGAWAARVWPRNYCLELCGLLSRAGIELAVVTERRAEDFGAFQCIHEKPLAFIAAAMQSAQLVIGNDSGPAHLAGTIGTKTLAIHGPTTERIFAHIPEVVSFRRKALECAGCHCLPPFRESCVLGCHELYRTFPEDVFATVTNLLGEQTKRITRNQKPRKGSKP